MHAYSISGQARKAVYLTTVACAAASSIAAGTWASPEGRAIVASASFAIVYALTYVILYRLLWRRPIILRRIGIADLSGPWTCTLAVNGDRRVGRVEIHQNLVTIDVRMELGTDRWRSVSAAFVRADGAVAVVMTMTDGTRFRSCRLDVSGQRCSGVFRDLAEPAEAGNMILEPVG